MIGQVPVVVRHSRQECELFVHVVDGEGPDLMGRDWLGNLKVTLGKIYALADYTALQEVLEKHSKLFCNKLGCLQGMEVKLNVDSNATPKFFKARTVPLALKEKLCQVEEHQHQLAHQCSSNIIGIWEWSICGLIGGAFIT